MKVRSMVHGEGGCHIFKWERKWSLKPSVGVRFRGLRDAAGTRGRRGSAGRSVAAGEKQQVAVELSRDITTLRGSQAKDGKVRKEPAEFPQAERQPSLSRQKEGRKVLVYLSLTPIIRRTWGVSLFLCSSEHRLFVFTSDHTRKSKSRVIIVNTQQSHCLGIDWGLASPLPSGAGCPAALSLDPNWAPPPVTTHTHPHTHQLPGINSLVYSPPSVP